jgi:predicted amidohydrolase
LLDSIPAERTFLKTGGSAVIAPDASYLAGPIYEDPRTLYAELDLSRLAEGRMYLDTHGHYARPDVFQLTVDTRARAGVRFEGGEDG